MSGTRGPVSHPLDSQRVLKFFLTWVYLYGEVVSHPLDSQRVLKSWKCAVIQPRVSCLTPPRLAESTEICRCRGGWCADDRGLTPPRLAESTEIFSSRNQLKTPLRLTPPRLAESTEIEEKNLLRSYYNVSHPLDSQRVLKFGHQSRDERSLHRLTPPRLAESTEMRARAAVWRRGSPVSHPLDSQRVLKSRPRPAPLPRSCRLTPPRLAESTEIAQDVPGVHARPQSHTPSTRREY